LPLVRQATFPILFVDSCDRQLTERANCSPPLPPKLDIRRCLNLKGVQEHLPDARVTFDKFHVVAHASKVLDGVRREQQRSDPALKGMRWSLLKDADKLNLAQLTDLELLLSQYTTNRNARAWMYREQLREILDRKQIHVVSKCVATSCVPRSKP
jgi:hypothetical protein